MGITNSVLYFLIGCPDYWTRLNTSLYAVFSSTKSWEHAEGFCRSMDAHLVKIESKDESSSIRSLLRDLNSTKLHWIGLTEAGNPWKWSDGSSLGSYSAWKYKKPANTSSNRDCVGLYGFPWHVRPCLRKHKFICEIKD